MKKLLFLLALPFVLTSCADFSKLTKDSGNDEMPKEEELAEESLNKNVADEYSEPVPTAGVPAAAQNLIYGGPKYHIGTSYKIEDVQYNPVEDWAYDQTGISGIIPMELNGVVTANGERFDTNAMIATSKVLPLPSIAKITNIENGSVAIVRVNGRGPFVNSRLMDVSPAAARALGMTGQTKVRVQIMKEESLKVKELSMTPAVVAEPAVAVEAAPVAVAGPYTIQVGAYYSEESANSIANRISGIGKASVVTEGGMYKVRLVGLNSENAKTSIERLRSEEDLNPGLLKDGRWVNESSL